MQFLSSDKVIRKNVAKYKNGKNTGFFSGFVNNTALLGLLEVANFENTTLIRTFLKDSLNVHEVQFDFETFT